MSTFGQQVESKEGAVIKMHTGVQNFKVVSVNPTKEELESFYGRELKYTPEYISKTSVTDADGDREVDQIRLDFYLENEDLGLKEKIQFYVENTHQKSSTGKFKVLNAFGKDTWLDKESIQSGQMPSNMGWYMSEGVKVAKRGEAEVISFLVNLLNLPGAAKAVNIDDAKASIDASEWDQIIRTGDVSILRNIIKGVNNSVGVLLGVKTKDDGKMYQQVMNKMTLRGFVMKGSRKDKYSPLSKRLDQAKASGSYSTIDFGPADLEFREYDVNPSKVNSSNESTEDIFSTAVEPAGADDWML
jgi:hypothetical protein